MSKPIINIRAAVELFGIISVVASLVFVGLEIQQNSAVARVQSQQASAQLLSNAFIVAAQDPDLAELIISINLGRMALEDLDRQQSARLYFFYLIGFQSGESAYYASQSGITAEADIAGMTESNLINPYTRSRWNAFRQNLSEPFAQYLESIADL